MRNSDLHDAVLWLALILVTVGCAVIYIFTNPEEPIQTLTATPIEVHDVIAPTQEEVEEVKPEEPKAPILSDEELIARVVMHEAEAEPFLVKVACAVCVYNRCDRYGETVETVLNKPNQFASGKNPNEDSIRAVEMAKKCRNLFDSRMIYFRASYYHEKYGEPYFTCGNTYFSIETNDDL